MRRTDDGTTINPQLLQLMSEDDFLRKVIDYAHWHNWLVAHFRPAQTGKGWRTPMQGDAGYIDLTLARNGVVLFYELKSERGHPTAAQIAWLSALAPASRLYRPSDWPKIQLELK